jgi:hypothetical protein
MVTTESRGWVGLIFAALAGCPTPAQEGGLLQVDTEGFARRLQMVCNSGHADPSCPPPAGAPAREDDAGSDDGARDDAADSRDEAGD